MGGMIPSRWLAGLLSCLVSVCAVFFAAGCGQKKEAPKPPPVVATLETDHGDIDIELLPDVAPKAVENFRLLSERGYYNGLIFHRIVKGFMIQTGDPEGSGFGGQSAWGKPFEDEIDKTSPLYRDGYKRGSVAMANMGKNSNGSQFFIVQTDFPLDASYTIFGKVTRGMEVVDKIISEPTSRGIGGMTKPVTPAVIKKVTITGEAVAAAVTGTK